MQSRLWSGNDTIYDIAVVSVQADVNRSLVCIDTSVIKVHML